MPTQPAPTDWSGHYQNGVNLLKLADHAAAEGDLVSLEDTLQKMSMHFARARVDLRQRMGKGSTWKPSTRAM